MLSQSHGWPHHLRRVPQSEQHQSKSTVSTHEVMTIRTLLRHLHGFAGIVGADADVQIQGLGRHMFIEAVKKNRKSIVLQTSKSPPKTGTCQTRVYQKRKKEGRCTRCGGPLGEEKTVVCEVCLVIARMKWAVRKQSAENNQP